MKTEQQYKKLTIGEFTKAADRYEGDHAGIYEMCREDYPYIAGELKKEAYTDLLDCGCGTGAMIALLHKKDPTKHYTGLDLTPRMIEVAKEKKLKGVEFLVGDCEELPFEDESFDVVICTNSFHHYPNPQKFFDRVSKVLRKNGRLILQDYTGPDAIVFLMNHIEMPLANLVGHGDVRGYTISEYEAFCKNAGLTVEELTPAKKMRVHLIARKGEEKPRADYKNWMPDGMVYGTAAAGTLLAGAGIGMHLCGILRKNSVLRKTGMAVNGLSIITNLTAVWMIKMQDAFSYDGKRQMSKQIIDGIAEYVSLPEDGVGLDVGCGSGALTIACAKRNPKARMVGIDRWGAEYASFSKNLCEHNAFAEGVSNVSFQKGNAVKLDFPDETFDAVTSNYVYHNIAGEDKQQLLRETLRVLKKGGTFAIHDIMSKGRYGDMETFVKELRAEGYRQVVLLDTTTGRFMSKWESKWMELAGSALLLGVK